jgi:hypothetical protein
MKKFLIYLLMALVMSMSTLAYVQMQSFSKDVSANDLITDCQVFNLTQTYCRVYQDIFTLDYNVNPKFNIGNGLSGRTFSDKGQGDYTAYINVKIDQFAVAGARYYGRVNKTFVNCDKYDMTIGNNSFLGSFYNHTDYGTNNVTFNDFIKINLKDNQYARCTFNTYYVNNSMFLTSSPIQWKLWKPTFKSTAQRPCELALFKAQDNLAICMEDQIGTAIVNKEYVKSAIKMFAYRNYELLTYLFWVFVIALLVFVIELIFFIPFILKRVVEKIMKIIRR